MHKTCSINYGHLADLQKTLPTTDLNKKTFHLIKYVLATFIFSFLFNLYLCYLERLQHLKPDMLVKQVYMDLLRLHNCGHNTWVTSVFELAQGYNLALGIDDYDRFKKNCRLVLTNCFKIKWLSEVRNDEKHPIVRTYSLHKREFCLEPYLDAVKDARYRSALTKLRASSHTLEIERGRYTVPKTPTSERLCSVCQEVEGEIHFLIWCTRYNSLWNEFFWKNIPN